MSENDEKSRKSIDEILQDLNSLLNRMPQILEGIKLPNIKPVDFKELVRENFEKKEQESEKTEPKTEDIPSLKILEEQKIATEIVQDNKENLVLSEDNKKTEEVHSVDLNKEISDDIIPKDKINEEKEIWTDEGDEKKEMIKAKDEVVAKEGENKILGSTSEFIVPDVDFLLGIATSNEEGGGKMNEDQKDIENENSKNENLQKSSFEDQSQQLENKEEKTTVFGMNNFLNQQEIGEVDLKEEEQKLSEDLSKETEILSPAAEKSIQEGDSSLIDENKNEEQNISSLEVEEQGQKDIEKDEKQLEEVSADNISLDKVEPSNLQGEKNLSLENVESAGKIVAFDEGDNKELPKTETQEKNSADNVLLNIPEPQELHTHEVSSGLEAKDDQGDGIKEPIKQEEPLEGLSISDTSQDISGEGKEEAYVEAANVEAEKTLFVAPEKLEEKTVLFEQPTPPEHSQTAGKVISEDELSNLINKQPPENVLPERIKNVGFMYSAEKNVLLNILNIIDEICLMSNEKPMFVRRSFVIEFLQDINPNYLVQKINETNSIAFIAAGEFPADKIYEINTVLSSGNILFRHINAQTINRSEIINFILELILR